MIFQDPMMALNPVHTIGRQIARGAAAASRTVAARRRCARAVELLRLVGIPAPAERARSIRTIFPAACASG